MELAGSLRDREGPDTEPAQDAGGARVRGDRAARELGAVARAHAPQGDDDHRLAAGGRRGSAARPSSRGRRRRPTAPSTPRAARSAASSEAGSLGRRHVARFGRSIAAPQRRMIVPPLTPPRVKLGTIGRRRAAAAGRHAARSSAADPTSLAVSAPAASGIFWLGRKPTTHGSCRCHRPGRSRQEPAARWPSFCTWPRSSREKVAGSFAPERLTGPRLPCAEEIRRLDHPPALCAEC